ncbi:MAG: chemotaxis protein CheW [Proteobacteria bacterium]|nr:chemotaxis protein CheW [Pseudomonadota bacterium]
MSQNTLENRYMEFTLGDQFFALPLISVKEVIQKPEVTSVPNMPAHFEGMMNLRGKIIGVFNVRKKLGVKKLAEKSGEKSNTSPEVVVVVEQNGISVGMLVDEVTKVIHATEDMLKQAPLKDDDASKKFILNVE